jgi:hypothetical protein
MAEQGRLLIFGLGYTGTAIGLAAAGAGFAVTVTSRQPDAAAPAGINVILFDAADEAIAKATHIVATAAPDDGGDPVLARPCDGSATCPRPGSMAIAAAAGWTRRARLPRPPAAPPPGVRRKKPGKPWAPPARRRSI